MVCLNGLFRLAQGNMGEHRGTAIRYTVSPIGTEESSLLQQALRVFE